MAAIPVIAQIDPSVTATVTEHDIQEELIESQEIGEVQWRESLNAAIEALRAEMVAIRQSNQEQLSQAQSKLTELVESQQRMITTLVKEAMETVRASQTPVTLEVIPVSPEAVPDPVPAESVDPEEAVIPPPAAVEQQARRRYRRL